MSRVHRERAALLLEDGTVLRGQAYGARGDTAGEVVFNTSMTGYQEILTDPSYRAQIVTMTYPHIGNYGVTPEDVESGRIQVAGFITRAPRQAPSNWRAQGDLESWLKSAGVVGLADVDTRALVRRLRTQGAMRGAIISGTPTEADLKARLGVEPPMEGRDLVREVSCESSYTWDAGVHDLDARQLQAKDHGRRFRVVALDFGVKHNILRLLVSHGCDVEVVPATTPVGEILARKPDGVFLSNGPGDPAAVGYAVDTVRSLIGQVPLFGICLGHQILALALGAQTFKLKFGHRGANQPVQDLETGHVEITSQNHGFAVDASSLQGPAKITHLNLNDKTVAGLKHESLPIFSVQYHPEASPGPRDSVHLFGRFTAAMAAQ